MDLKDKIIDVLKTINDPELDLDIYNLGLVYDITVKDNHVKILMTFTTPLCPYGPMLIDIIEHTLKESLPEIADVEIEITFDPPWQPSTDLRAVYGI